MTAADILTQIEDALPEVYRPDGVRIWMTVEHKQFGGLTVEQMLDAGRCGEVLARIDQLSSGSFS